MGMSSGHSGGPQSDINVTPLVDVCLVLLIIFMVMVPNNVPEISVRVPPSIKNPKSNPSQNDNLVVGLNKDGGVYLNRNPMEKTRLAEEIARVLENRDANKKVVFVDFDGDANYGEAVEILGVAKQGGAKVLGIVKKKDKPTPDTLAGI